MAAPRKGPEKLPDTRIAISMTSPYDEATVRCWARAIDQKTSLLVHQLLTDGLNAARREGRIPQAVIDDVNSIFFRQKQRNEEDYSLDEIEGEAYRAEIERRRKERYKKAVTEAEEKAKTLSDKALKDYLFIHP